MSERPLSNKDTVEDPKLAMEKNRNEKLHDFLLNLAVLGGIAAVAYTDYVVVTISLGYLYLLPLSLSAVVHRRRTSMLLVAFCAILHEWFGPFEHAGSLQIFRNSLTVVGFTVVVLLISSLVGQRRRLTETVRQQRDELAREVQLAAEVQRRLLPLAPPRLDGFDIAGEMYPAKTVGGDYFDYIELPDGRLGLAVADVSGKGMPAALLMPAVETALHMAARSSLPLAETISGLNRTLYDVTDESRFVTLFCAILNPKSLLLEYCSAGHHPGLLARAGERDPIWLEKGGALLGLLPEVAFETGTIQLAPGDTLVLYTDGVIEAQDQNEEEYSKERLCAAVLAHRQDSAQDLVRRVYNEVTAFTHDPNLRDDLTLIVLKVRPWA
jgi:serine phosphatase RsbU (regulator of sigma subunit)